MSEIKDLKETMLQQFEQINKQFEKMNKRMDSHENMTVQLLSMVNDLSVQNGDIKREIVDMRQDIEFTYKESAITRLELDRIKREHV